MDLTKNVFPVFVTSKEKGRNKNKIEKWERVKRRKNERESEQGMRKIEMCR
jgi:hypothetical protein